MTKQYDTALHVARITHEINCLKFRHQKQLEPYIGVLTLCNRANILVIFDEDEIQPITYECDRADAEAIAECLIKTIPDMNNSYLIVG